MRVEGFNNALYEYGAFKKDGQKGFSRYNLLSFNKGAICKDFDEAYDFWFARFKRKYNEIDAALKAQEKAIEEHKKYMVYFEYLEEIKNDVEGFKKFCELKKLFDSRRKV